MRSVSIQMLSALLLVIKSSQAVSRIWHQMDLISVEGAGETLFCESVFVFKYVPRHSKLKSSFL